MRQGSKACAPFEGRATEDVVWHALEYQHARTWCAHGCLTQVPISDRNMVLNS